MEKNPYNDFRPNEDLYFDTSEKILALSDRLGEEIILENIADQLSKELDTLNTRINYVSLFREKYAEIPAAFEVKTAADKSLNYMLNAAIKKVSEDVGGRFSFNTAISSIMELVNEMYRYKETAEPNIGLLGKAVKELIIILSPFTPHICEEMWEHMGQKESLTTMAWPEFDEDALVKDEVEIVVQVNGKVKDKVLVANNASREELEKIAMENEKIQALLEGKTVVKVVAVPNRLLNIVVK